MNQRLLALVLTLVLGLGVWGAAVSFTPVTTSFSAGLQVSAQAFNDLFATINDNFVSAKAAIEQNESGIAAVAAFDANLVAGACAAGEAVQGVQADGTPLCVDAGLELPFDANVNVAAGNTVFEIENVGTGNVARFRNNNFANIGVALDAVTNAQAQSLALRAQNFGLGSAAFFMTSNNSSSSDTIRVVNANGSNGGRAGIFEIFSTENTATALEAQATAGRAGRFVNTATNALLPALEAVSSNPTTATLLVGNSGGTGAAAFFSGGVAVSGTLSVTGTKNFRIDHPLAPDRMYLNHFAVESNEIANLYAGNVTLDEGGAAWVELPGYFDVLNTDVRYQLSAIGAPAPYLHVAVEVSGNRFKVAGGEPGMRVSWQVSAVRDDPSVHLLSRVVEEPKPEHEVGTYLHPAAYGMPAELGLAARFQAQR